MNVTRDIVIDLLPVYAAGEASTDTRTVVEEFSTRDDRVRNLLAALQSESLAAEVTVPPALEKEVVERTRRVIARRSWTLALAVFFSLLPLTIVVRAGQVTFWMLRDAPQSMWFWASAAALWIYYAKLTRALR